MFMARSISSRLPAALTLDRAFIEGVERNPRGLGYGLGFVAAAGAGRGVTPGFEAGWIPLVGHAIAGVFIWLFIAGLVWNVAHRLLGYSAGYAELARVLALAAIPLLGLWLNASPFVAGLPWFGIALHVLAFVGLVAVTRAALATSTRRALGICRF